MFSLLPVRRTQQYDVPKTIDRFFDDPFFHFFNELDATFEAWSPAVEITETDDGFRFEFEVPGIEQKNIDISVEDGILSVTGERISERKDEDRIRTERRYGKFVRSFRLPESADTDKVAAKLKNGILMIEIPKREETKPRKIKVKVS